MTDANPYQHATVPESADTGWAVHGSTLCGGPLIELPKICYRTLNEEGLVSFDAKVRSTSPILTAIWGSIAMVLVVAGWVVPGIPWWVRLGAVLIMCGFAVASRLRSTAVRLRIYESQSVHRTRRTPTAGSRALSMVSLIAIGLMFFVVMDSGPTPLLIGLVVVAVAVYIFLPLRAADAVVESAPELTVRRDESGTYCIDGFSREFLSALQKLKGAERQ